METYLAHRNKTGSQRTFRERHPEKGRRMLTGIRAKLSLAVLYVTTRQRKLKFFHSRSPISHGSKGR